MAIIFFYYIDLHHWREDEFLLNKGSRFLVTGLDKENGFINVKYLGDKCYKLKRGICGVEIR